MVDQIHEAADVGIQSLGQLPTAFHEAHASLASDIEGLAEIRRKISSLKSTPLTASNRQLLNAETHQFEESIQSLRTGIQDHFISLLQQLTELKNTNRKLYTELSECPMDVIHAIFVWIPTKQARFARTNLLKHITQPYQFRFSYPNSIWDTGNELYSKVCAEESILSQMHDLNFGGYTLSPSVFKGICTNLVKLRKLCISRSTILDHFPAEIGNLIHLESLALNDCWLKGSIPADIGNLNILVTLKLSQNRLRGEIPVELFSCTYLENLDLSHNQLEGEIPESIGDLMYLKRLELNNNSLSGSVPETILQCRQLRKCDFCYNKDLKCSFPFEFRQVQEDDEEIDYGIFQLMF
ncbi:hypothetical protein HDU79_000007 [Rhizoclosmatium sp. JEL0117]|nr:hypothetical protein HDU79_000007 [Rhizoclosmatium sp. JEL0117]